MEKQTQMYVLWCSFHVIEIDVIGGFCVFYLTETICCQIVSDELVGHEVFSLIMLCGCIV